jgi:hypothetical protein
MKYELEIGVNDHPPAVIEGNDILAFALDVAHELASGVLGDRAKGICRFERPLIPFDITIRRVAQRREIRRDTAGNELRRLMRELAQEDPVVSAIQARRGRRHFYPDLTPTEHNHLLDLCGGRR